MPNWTKDDLHAYQARRQKLRATEPECAKGMPLDMNLVWASYQELKSVHRVGAKFGASGETIRQSLVRAGYRLNNTNWTEDEKQLLRDYYANTPDEQFHADAFAVTIGRTPDAIHSMASKLRIAGSRETPKGASLRGKLVKNRHIPTTQERQNASVRQKLWLANNPHPKGMSGKHHSDATKAIISKIHLGKKVPRERVMRQLKTMVEKYGRITPNIRRGSWAAGWRSIGGKKLYARSRWEANYARYLEFLKAQNEILEWEHEPKTFWFNKIKRGVRSYMPDFRVTFRNGKEEYHEVKGWMDSKSATKIKRMKKYHPSIVLRVIDGKWFKANTRKLSCIVHGWESPTEERTEVTIIPPVS